MKLLKKIALTTASLAITLTTVSVKSASAAIINYAFKVNTPLTQGSGFFSFDDATFNNDNFPVAPVNSLNFTFDNDPQTVYTEKDDIDYPTLGPVIYQNVAGQSSFGLSYLFTEKSNSLTNYAVDGYSFRVGDQEFSNAITYTPVPEPATIGGCFIVCGISLLMNRKTKSS
ncbi:PEP-CTERM sorting domain-containing protein [Nostoc sp. CENA67]|uniref:PEP-CTERM sorting domain-containing protein n=1 Tax=Amazonocrinis nigriterrae CENA67 TaxID=2794033 RepID=A0A8J7HV60_9NOST|nr:PEP-CTERM sorting domain-containing protein [Amazonocrinis nigriterrae]MBH8566396.1 PEP-CTERM sorting domain-containing protein [Amazonocrinis nigriterrae CENA67]